MITKDQRMRFILEDEPNRMRKMYKGETLDVYQNSSDEYPILNDQKSKQKIKTIYRRKKQF